MNRFALSLIVLYCLAPSFGADVVQRQPVKMVFPTYPAYAVKGNHEGTVIATFQVTKEGNIEGLNLVGDPLFYLPVSFALEKWTYSVGSDVTKHRIEVRFKRLLVEGMDHYDEVSFVGGETIEVCSKFKRVDADVIPRKD